MASPFSTSAPASIFDRLNRPCVTCGGPIGRSHMKARLCYACWREKYRGSSASRNRKLTRAALAAVLSAVIRDPDRREAVQASLEAGEQLRVFLCACQRLYIGANRRQCSDCLAEAVEDERA